MKCITILYPAKDNEGFDYDFYRNRHAPLIKEILGPALHRLEARRGGPGPSGQPAAYAAVVSIWIADWAAYESAVAGRTQELLDELPLFTAALPLVQIDDVLLEL